MAINSLLKLKYELFRRAQSAHERIIRERNERFGNTNPPVLGGVDQQAGIPETIQWKKGPIIFTESHVLPYDEGLAFRASKALSTDGGESSYYKHVAEGNPETGHFYIGKAHGKWFGTCYGVLDRDGGLLQYPACNYLHKVHPLTPLLGDCILEADVAFNYPELNEGVCLVDRGNLDVPYIGMQLHTFTDIGWCRPDGRYGISHASSTDIAMIREAGRPATDEYPAAPVHHLVPIFIPDGVEHIVIAIHTYLDVFAGTGFGPLVPGEYDKYAIAMLNLREPGAGDQYEILRYPFTNESYPAVGGIQVTPTLRYYKPYPIEVNEDDPMNRTHRKTLVAQS